MMFESVCYQCDYCVRDYVGLRKGMPLLYELSCKYGSPNFMSQDGCWQFTHEDDEEREDE